MVWHASYFFRLTGCSGRLLLLLVQLLPEVVAAKTSVPCDLYRLDGAYFQGYWTDIHSLVSAPFGWTGGQWAYAGGVAAVGVALYWGVDQPLNGWFQANKTELTSSVSRVFKLFKNGRDPMLAVLGLYGLGVISQQDRVNRVALTLMESCVLTGMMEQTTKLLTHRRRPRGNHGTARHNIWEGPHIRTLDSSFYSGHASTAWGVATVLASEFEQQKWVGPVVYGIASFTALSRVHDNAHWPSDVFIGAVMGHAIGKTIVSRMSRDYRGPIPTLVIGSDIQCVNVLFRF